MSGADPAMSTPLILLDLDGTLIATRQLYVEALARCLAPHVGRHMEEDEIMGLHPRSEIRFIREFVAPRGLPGALEHFYAEYASLHEALFRGAYEGVPAALAALREEGAPLGLVTGKSLRAWEITRRHVDLGAFDVLVFDDDVREGKPDPEGLHLAREWSGHREGGVYVGDSVTDLDAAVAAGLAPAGVLWSKREHEKRDFALAVRVRGGEPLETPADLLSLLGPVPPIHR